MLVRRKCPQYKICVYYSQGEQKTKNFFLVPNKWKDSKFDHPCPQGFFSDENEHFIRFVMQNRSTT